MSTKTEKETSNHDKYFQKKLLDPTFIKEYINAALDEVDEIEDDPKEVLATLISCIKDIVEAHGGVDSFLNKFNVTNINRATIYKTFKYIDEEKRKNGPEFITVYKILKVCGGKLRAA